MSEAAMILALEAKIEELLKSAQSSDDSIKYTRESNNSLSREIEEIHKLLDTLPNAPSRKTPADIDEEGKEIKWTSYDRSVMVRLAGWLAIRK